MSVLRDSLTRRYLPSNPQNNSLYTAPTTEKKRLLSEILLQFINVQSQSLMILAGKSKSVQTV